MLHIVDNEMKVCAQRFGCIRRETWKFLDAAERRQPAESTECIVEALWPRQGQAEVFIHAERSEDVRKWWDEMMAGVEAAKGVRYVREGR